MNKQQDGKEAEQKEKKVKIVYYDDGSTVVDMSGTRKKGRADRPKSTAREKARTFFAVMKKMVVPMLCTLAAFTLIYILLLWITGNI